MSSDRFREAILAEHETLRSLIAQTLDVATGDADPGRRSDDLRGRARQLYLSLQDHLAIEERMLSVALRDVIGWGEMLEASIAEDHGRQRNEVASALTTLEAGGLSLGQLVEDLRVFTDHLLRDMAREEDGLLVADLDAVATDAEGG